MSTSPGESIAHPDPRVRPSSFWRWAPLLVVAAAWLSHEGARHNTWVLEDVLLVRDDPQVARGPAALADLLGAGWRPSETARGPYGPLVRASFALEAPLWRRSDGTLAPGGFHLTNLLLHGLCALLLFRLVLGLLPRRPVVALATGLCFAAHPLHVATVGTLMGRGELLAGLFALLAVFAWRSFGPGRPGWLVVATLCALLAVLSKEVALGLPLALLLLDRACPPVARLRGGWRPPWPAWLVLFVVPVALFVLSGGAQAGATSGLAGGGAAARLATGLDGWGRLLLLLLVPVGLRGDHTDEAVPGLGYQLHAGGWILVALVGLITAGVLVRALRGRAGTGAVLWGLSLAVALPAVLVGGEGAAYESRFAYLAAMPLVLVAGLLLESLAARRGRTERPSTIACSSAIRVTSVP